MYDYYEDERYYEPTIADEIFIEYQQKLKDALKNSVKSNIENIESENARLKEENKKLRTETYELKGQINNNIKETEKLLKEKEREVFVGFTSGFAPHDTIWYIESKRTETTCKYCNGKYKIKVDVLGKTKEVDCPHCSYGKISHYTYYPVKDIISSFYFNYHRADRNLKNSGVVLNIEKIYLDKYDSYKSVDNLYKTLEECQNVCDERNKAENDKMTI